MRAAIAIASVVVLGLAVYATDNNLVSGEQTCAGKRFLLDNLIDHAACARLRNVAAKVLTEEPVGNELRGTNLWQLMAHPEKLSLEDVNLLNSTRQTMLSTVRRQFNNNNILYEYTLLTSRDSGAEDYSHGLHVDQCNLDFETGVCVEREENCCAWRSHSALLYLNDCGVDYEGGEFVFKNSLEWQKDDDPCYGDDWVIAPSCGTMVSFDSGKGNVHGVNRVAKGRRYAMTIWFTLDPYKSERVFDTPLPCVGDSCKKKIHDEL